MRTEQQEEKLTYNEAADRIGVPVATIRAAAKRGDLIVIRHNATVVRIRLSDLLTYECGRIDSNAKNSQ